VVLVAVTRYSTVPAVALLGLVSDWLIVLPLPADAPVILPVIVPTVQVNVLADDAVNPIAVVLPLQIVAVFAVVTTGRGLTVTTIG